MCATKRLMHRSKNALPGGGLAVGDVGVAEIAARESVYPARISLDERLGVTEIALETGHAAGTMVHRGLHEGIEIVMVVRLTSRFSKPGPALICSPRLPSVSVIRQTGLLRWEPDRNEDNRLDGSKPGRLAAIIRVNAIRDRRSA
jgi:hypothetical protein